MKVVRLCISNFRGIKSATLLFDGHTLLVGSNNVGKSSICEALDLVLGPDRLNRTQRLTSSTSTTLNTSPRLPKRAERTP